MKLTGLIILKVELIQREKASNKQVQNSQRNHLDYLIVIIKDVNISTIFSWATAKFEKYWKTMVGKTRLWDKVRVYRQHIGQSDSQQLKVKEEHFRICANGKLLILPLLQMQSNDINLRESFYSCFQKKKKKSRICHSTTICFVPILANRLYFACKNIHNWRRQTST